MKSDYIAIKDFDRREIYAHIVQKQLTQYLWDFIYKPLFKVAGLKLSMPAINYVNPILEALKNNEIYYIDGGFRATEKFSNQTAIAIKEAGGVWDKWTRTYKISQNDLPQAVNRYIQRGLILAREQLMQINNILFDIENNLDLIIEDMIFDKQIIDIVKDAGQQFTISAKKIHIINPDFSQQQLNEISQDYTNNMQFYIKDWAQEKIPEMREIVQKMVMDGERQEAVQKMLENQFGIASRKAKFLAQNETSIMMSELKKVHYQEMGFTGFFWNTIIDGKERPLHAKHNGKYYSYDNLPIIDERTGQRGLPGQTYNCLTGDMKILTPYLYNRIYRRKFRGETVTLITPVNTIELTFNHPVLTDKGWVKAGLLQKGDKIAKIRGKSFFGTEANPQNGVTSIDEFFSFNSILFNPQRINHTNLDFHGDPSIDNQVDIVNIEVKLRDYVKTEINKSRLELLFAEADKLFGTMSVTSDSSFSKAFPIGRFISNSFISGFDKAFSFFFGSKSHSIEHTFRAIAWLNSVLYEVTGYDSSTNPEFFSKLFNTSPLCVKLYQRILWELTYIMIDRFIIQELHAVADCFIFNAETFRNGFDTQTTSIEFDTITDKIIRIFDGHIYNLENTNNWYLCQDYITKNCRCTMTPVRPSSIFYEG